MGDCRPDITPGQFLNLCNEKRAIVKAVEAACNETGKSWFWLMVYENPTEMVIHLRRF